MPPSTACCRYEQGRFPDLKDRDGLWALLVVLTTPLGGSTLLRHHLRDSRGGGMVHGESALQLAEGDSGPAGLDALPGDEPTPLEAALLAEEVESLLARLRDPVLRQVAVWKLEGYTNADIATRLGCSEPTVERRLAIIRRVLKKTTVMARERV